MITLESDGPGRPVVLPADSRASRRIATKSRLSVRGFIVATFPGEPHGRRIGFESGRERDLIFLMQARSDVASIIEQPFVVPWVDEAGRQRRYTPDFLLTLTDGHRLAVEVKCAERAGPREFQATLSAIAAQMSRDLADGVVLFTDAHYQAWEVINAAQLHEARKRADAEADAALVVLSRKLRGNISVGDLSRMLDRKGRGFQAIVRAIFGGGLRLVTPGIIGPRSRVAARGMA